MRALDPEVVDVVWQAVEPLVPSPAETHPLGCHRPRVPDQLCFRGILIRLVTGASWVDIEAILDHQVSDTTLRARRDEWIDAGVFDQVRTEALGAFDRIIGLDPDDVAVDGSLHKAPTAAKAPARTPPTERGYLEAPGSAGCFTASATAGRRADMAASASVRRRRRKNSTQAAATSSPMGTMTSMGMSCSSQ